MLVLNIAVVLIVAIALPFTLLGRYFGFTSLPLNFLLLLAVFVVAYIGLVELVKVWFYRRYSNLGSA